VLPNSKRGATDWLHARRARCRGVRGASRPLRARVAWTAASRDRRSRHSDRACVPIPAQAGSSTWAVERVTSCACSPVAARMRLSLLGSTRRQRWWRWLKRRQRRTAPLLDDAFDLVLSTISFDHWIDQRAGLRECARVLVADGRLVLVDLLSAFLIPTLVGGRRTRARTKPRANRLLAGEGLHPVGWQHVPLPDQRCRSCQVARNTGDRSAALLLGAERLGHRVRAVTPAIGSVSPESAAHGTRSKWSTTPRTGSVWLERNG
jgi:hypothetical protein